MGMSLRNSHLDLTFKIAFVLMNETKTIPVVDAQNIFTARMTANPPFVFGFDLFHATA